jgi:cysteine desulfurase / selenocysteine lyase
MDFKKYRSDFNILKNNKIIYFDNAASSLKPNQVIEGMNKYYLDFPTNIHRGIHKLSMQASIIFQDTREKVSRFINSEIEEVVFTQNSTDAINLVMYSLYNSDYFKKDDEILVSILEHHANLVPWLFLSKKLGLKLKFIDLKSDFTLDLDDFKNKMSEKTKLIAITHVSNTTGTIVPIKEIVSFSKKYNCKTLIDASQSVPHMKVNFKEINCDFLVFTGHKMLGPTGIGCLISKKENLEILSPYKFGGDMIRNVSMEEFTVNNIPYKFEAGTPNISGVFGLSFAIDYLLEVGLENILNQDKALLKYALKRTEEINNLELFNPKDENLQAPILLFRLKGIDASDLSAVLDDMSSIATRAGVHCAEPIVTRFDKNGLSRASFYFYNTFEEIDIFIESLKTIDFKINK